MDLILDCESTSSTKESLSSLFSCSKNDLISMLDSIDIEVRNQDVECSSDEYLFQKAIQKFGVNAVPTMICWFHLTRTIQGATFEQGILPLGKALDLIWETLLNIFTGSEHQEKLIDLKESGVENYRYNLKTPDSLLWGPFAMLIKESAFKYREMENPNYLRLPEIIEDICNAYYDKYGISIHDDVVNTLKPCIVKFKSHKRLDDGCVKTALYYLHASVQRKRLCIYSNTCFDGKGEIIPYEDILKIEFIDMP